MNLSATIANSLWHAANLPAYLQFRAALWQPEATQRRLLKSYLKCNAQTLFGRAHGFNPMGGYQDFAQRVPLMDYEGLEPWMEQIRRGESNVLTREPVTRLIPTSGSTGARKLIAFTGGLQREFNAAIGPWMIDLLGQSPGIAGGPAYWSVTPMAGDAEPQGSKVPIGFDADAAYLGGTRQRLVSAVLVAPAELRLVKDMETFRYLTLLCLLRQRDLRLISVWHPSFLSLLLEALPACWEELLENISTGECRHAQGLLSTVRQAMQQRPLPERAKELRRADPQNPETLWPQLKLISCWGDGSAEFAVASLKKHFPHTRLQPKGLLATEAFVTLPFAGAYPVAIRSHFFEFIDEEGGMHLVHELHEEETYEVVVTTAGGLWRYRLRDRVQVTGFVGATPSLRFLGRAGNVSDLFGEKLSEAFVAQTIHEILASHGATPHFVMLAPDEDKAGWRYTLYLEGAPFHGLAKKLDAALSKNPQYAYCRKLTQLLSVRVYAISAKGYETFAARQRERGVRLGEIKPTCFSPLAGWSERFSGAYCASPEIPERGTVSTTTAASRVSQ